MSVNRIQIGETAKMMAERGACFVPTLTVYDLLLANSREWGLAELLKPKLSNSIA